MKIEGLGSQLGHKDIGSNVLNGEVIRSNQTGRLYIKGVSGITCLEDGIYIYLSNLEPDGMWTLVKAKVVVTNLQEK